MKAIGIISAMWEELELIHSAMTDVKEYKYAEKVYYEGKLFGKSAVLTVCGIGKVSAAIYTQIMIDKFDVGTIIQTGVAGSMDAKATHFSLVVANSLTYHSVHKPLLRTNYPYTDYFTPDEKLSSLLYDAARAELPESSHMGLIITGDDFISAGEVKDNLKKEFPSALCTEMEGCAVANVATVNGIPFAIIRCISDLADESASGDFKEFEKIASKRAASIVLSVMKNI